VLSLFLIGVIVLAVLGHGYLWVDAVNRLHAWAWPRKWVDGATLACFLAFLALPPLILLSWAPIDLGNLNPAGIQSFWLRHYLLFCAIWGGFKLLICSIYWYTTDNPKTLLEWRQERLEVASKLDQDLLHGWLPRLLAKVPGNQVFQLTVDHKRLAIPRLDTRLEGLKIAHISDLHMTGRIGPQWYEVVAAQVDQLQADIIIVTGDIVEKEACWPWLANSLGKLRAKHGVYFILGNHDFYIDVAHTRKLLEEQELICLSQCWAEVECRGATVMLAGNERPWNPQVTDLSAVPTRSSQQQLRILLLHTPDQFAWACEQDADLTLAGHTHGGQLRFPLLGPIVCPSHYGTRYACGVFGRGNNVMHVTRGIAGKTPLRWRCPPEIALLELVRRS